MANIAAKASMPTVTPPVMFGADLGQGLKVEQLAIADVSPPSGQTQSDASAVQQALTLIVGYIPTEIVVTYVAVVAAIDSAATGSRVGQWVAFWFFLALSPSLCWVLYATNLRMQGRATPMSPKQWPHGDHLQLHELLLQRLRICGLSFPRQHSRVSPVGRSDHRRQ
jgi:hypothetical protein